MKVYHLKPEGFVEVRRRYLFQCALWSSVTLTVFAFASYKTGDTFPLLVFAPFALILAFSYWRELVRQRKSWLSYELHVGSDDIVRKQEGYSDVQIRAEEITTMEERLKPDVWGLEHRYSTLARGPGLFIRTRDQFKYIFVHRNLEGYEEVKSQLALWGVPRSSVSRTIRQLIVSAEMILSMSAAWFAGRIQNKDLSRAVHFAAAIGMLWASVEMRRDAEIPTRARRAALVLLVLGIFEMLRAVAFSPLR